MRGREVILRDINRMHAFNFQCRVVGVPKSEWRFPVGNKRPQGAAHPLGQLGKVGDLLNAIIDGTNRVAERILALQIAKLIGKRQIMRGRGRTGHDISLALQQP